MNRLLENIGHYIVGNVRYSLYYSKLSFLIPKYIKEQIKTRILSMDEECYERGTCKICGCKTTALQMANKACPKPCYPSMIEEKGWKKLREDSRYFRKEGGIKWHIKGLKFEKL